MATIPIIGKVTVNGASKNISGGYVNIGGVWKPIVKTYVNVNGVWKNAWKTMYTWAKYSVNSSTGYVAEQAASTSSLTIQGVGGKISAAREYTFDTQTGAFSLPAVSTSSISFSSYKGVQISAYPYVMDNNNLYKVVSRTSYSSGMMQSIVLQVYLITAVKKTKYEKGNFIGNVTAASDNAYPANGVHTDGYWYVKQ
jgi:hypothetical protein